MVHGTQQPRRRFQPETILNGPWVRTSSRAGRRKHSFVPRRFGGLYPNWPCRCLPELQTRLLHLAFWLRTIHSDSNAERSCSSIANRRFHAKSSAVHPTGLLRVAANAQPRPSNSFTTPYRQQVKMFIPHPVCQSALPIRLDPSILQREIGIVMPLI